MHSDKKQVKKQKKSRIRTPDSSVSPYTKFIIERNKELIIRFGNQEKA